MAEKLSWTELRRTLAARAGVSEKKAGAFLNAMQAQLVEALKQDKQVKINGLGTFKLQAVAPRKSVNVSTGEEIIIEGYNKLAFAPEAGVKELVEKVNVPLSEEEAAEAAMTDPIQKLGAQAEEIKDILGDLGQSPVEEEPAPEPEPEPEPEPAYVPEPEPAYIPEPEPAPAPEPEPVYNPEPTYVPQPNPVYIPEPEIIVQRPKQKESHFLRDLLICVIILLLLLFVGYFFFRQQISDLIQSFIKPAETEAVVPVVADTTAYAEAAVYEEPVAEEPAVVEAPAVQEEKKAAPKKSTKKSKKKKKAQTISQEQILAEFLQASEEDVEAPEEDVEAPEEEFEGTEDYPDLITIEPMHEASRLTWMSKRYYGDKAYWPYLYDANRDVISNPNIIDTGTPIRVPRLTEDQLDTTSIAFEELREEAEAACMK